MIEQKVRPEVRPMARPRHGGDVWHYDGIKDYSSNVNPLGAPPRLEEYIMEAARDLHNYPDDTSSQLREAIARRYDVGAENVIVGAGSAELIRLFPEVFVSPRDRVIIPCPTFSEYSFACQLMGARIIEYPLPFDNDFSLDVAELMARLGGVKAVYVCNPNNPTSRMVGRRDLLDLVQEAERKGTLVFLDETLLELSSRSDELSLVPEVEGQDNLFIIRSFTKAFAMPGIRVGYGLGSREMIRFLEAGRLTWNLGTIEQRVATRLMENEQEHVARAVRLLEKEKGRMQVGVEKHLGPVPSPHSYFFFAPLGDLGVSSSQFRTAMLRHDVLVRDCSSFGERCEGYSRFCVKTPEKDDEFLVALGLAVEEIREGRH